MNRRARIVVRSRQRRTPSAIFTSPTPLSAEQREAVARAWVEQAGRAHRPSLEFVTPDAPAPTIPRLVDALGVALAGLRFRPGTAPARPRFLPAGSPAPRPLGEFSRTVPNISDEEKA